MELTIKHDEAQELAELLDQLISVARGDAYWADQYGLKQEAERVLKLCDQAARFATRCRADLTQPQDC